MKKKFSLKCLNIFPDFEFLKKKLCARMIKL